MAVNNKNTNKNKKKVNSVKKATKPLVKNNKATKLKTYTTKDKVNSKNSYNKTNNKTNSKSNNIKNKSINKKTYNANNKKKVVNYKNKVLNNKSKNIKKSVVVNKVEATVSNTELLDKILEESKQKKLNKKKTLAHKNQVQNKVVIDILKDEGNKKKEQKVKDDLIITREIDLSDLDEYLTQESHIIEQNIDEEVSREYSDEEPIVVTETKEKKKKEKTKKQKEERPTPEPSIRELVDLSKGRLGPSISFWNIVVIVVLLIMLIVVIVVGTKVFAGKNSDIKSVQKIFVDKKAMAKEKEKEREVKANLYKECLIEVKNELDSSEEINNYINDLNSYFSSKYRASIRYIDTKHGFDYSFNTDKTYYAASTIKALDGLYIYSKAATGEINLDDKMTYTSKYNLASSFYMTKHKYGDKISVRDLVRYAITRSDNRAHQMLVDYIGAKKLKEYGLSLGATKTLVGDIFGSINVDDAIIYWQEINKFIENNGELGEELKSYFQEADQNYLSIPDEHVIALHKYGEYENYYHDIGIVYADNPYIIAILSTEGRGQYEAMIKDINMKIYELNKMYVSNREKSCHNEVYK